MTTPKLDDVEKVTELVVEDVPVDDGELTIEALDEGVIDSENVAIVEAVGKNEIDTGIEGVRTLVMVTVPETAEVADIESLEVDERIVEIDADREDDTVRVPRDDTVTAVVIVRIVDRVIEALVIGVAVGEEDAVVLLDADLQPDAVGLGDDVKSIELLKKDADTDAEGKIDWVPLLVVEPVALAELLDDNTDEAVMLLVSVLSEDAEVLDEIDAEEEGDGDCDWLSDGADDSVFVPDSDPDMEAEPVVAAEEERFNDVDPEFVATFTVRVITVEDDTLIVARKLAETLSDPPPPRAAGPELKVAK
jgi:hypothetical protein